MAVPAVPASTRRVSPADLSVRTKVLAAVLLAALVTVVVWGTGLIGLKRTSDAANLIATSNIASVEAVGQLKAAVAQTQVDSANQALSPDPAVAKTFTSNFEADLTAFDTAIQDYRDSNPASTTEAIDSLASTWSSYATIAKDTLLTLGSSNQLAQWSSVRDEQVTPLLATIDSTLATMDKTEQADAVKNADSAKSTYGVSRNLSTVVMLLGLIVAVGVGVVVGRAIVTALNRVRSVCEDLARGDLTHTTGLTSRDEPGQMGRALDTAIASLRQTVRTIGESSASLAGATEQLSATAAQIAEAAQSTSSQSQHVSEEAEQVARSVDTVSAGGEEMGAAIREISQNAAQAAEVAGEAVRLTETTSQTMAQLGESSVEIGNIVKVITTIAEQTNLLALNATIEAARAGDAGKGFAVVAEEVKQLAQETARATEDISHRVEAIQADTSGSVEAISEVSAVIHRISEFQTTIASAVEEQSATTSEMNRSVAEAASGTGEISRSIDGVASAATATSRGADETQAATAELARMSSQLNSVVAGFRL